MEKTQDAFNKSEALINAILEKISGIKKSRKNFMLKFYKLMLGLPGRYNFLNMSRYGSYSEQTYRNNFEKRFDFLTFNTHLIRESCSSHLINAFDPSYIQKIGKETDHIGMFWSGCAQKVKKGIEIGGFAVVYSQSLKRKIKLAYVEFWKDGEYTGQYAVLFSTDLELSGQLIYLYYKSRFQIEFLFRDAKQFVGLTHCQARSENKLHFHFNASLTTVSIAKAVYYLDIPKEQRGSFSMSDIKTMYLNKIMADRIFSNLELDLSCKKIRRIYRDALCLGKIAA